MILMMKHVHMLHMNMYLCSCDMRIKFIDKFGERFMRYIYTAYPPGFCSVTTILTTWTPARCEPLVFRSSCSGIPSLPCSLLNPERPTPDDDAKVGD